MKKLLALLMALLMALSCVSAIAEGAQDTQPELPVPQQIPAMTTVSKLHVNEEQATQLLGGLLGEDNQEVFGYVMALLNNLGARVVSGPQGVQEELTLKDTPIFTVAGGMGEEGLVLVSDMFPSYAFTLSNETIAKVVEALSKLDLEAIMTAVATHVQNVLTKVMSKVGEPEMGEWEFEGGAFNVRVPLEMDIRELALLEIEEIKALLAEDAIAPLVAKAAGEQDIAAKLDEAAAAVQNAETVPQTEVYIYANSEKEDYTYVTLAVATEEQLLAFCGGTLEDKVAYHMLSGPAIYADEESMREAAMSGDGQAMALDVNIEPTDEGMLLTEEVHSQIYMAMTAEIKMGEEGVEETMQLYVLTDAAPLLTAEVSMVPGGEITADLSLEGKTAVPVEEMVKGDAQELLQPVLADVVSNGLNSLMANAAAVMPDEVVGLITLLSTPAESESAPLEGTN